MNKHIVPRKGFRVAGSALIVMVFTILTAESASPPPPDGPPAPILTEISVSGATVLDEGSSELYVCTAIYSDNTTVTITPNWSEDSSYTTIDGAGILFAGDVPDDQGVTVTATYAGFTDTLDVTIQYVTPVLSSIAITGPATVNELTTAQYVCTATYSDGSSAVVSAGWSENSSAATINGSGLLSAGDVSADQSVIITASFGGKSDTHATTIGYVPGVLSGVSISGPTSLDEETTGLFICTATYSDGTSEGVVPSWSENSSFTTISGSGALTAGNVTSDQSVTITASYGGRSDTHSVTIKYVAPTLESIAISGPTLVDEESSAQYICTAT